MRIDKFDGKYSFLSNFYEAPFWYQGQKWKTVEHAFQAAKCLNQSDKEKIYNAATPAAAKSIGRKVTMIPGWDYKRIDVMRKCLQMKFLTNDELLQKLLDTGDAALVEGNTWHDNYWGVCSCSRCKDLRTHNNMLGKLLMEIRDHCKKNEYLWVARDMKNGGKVLFYFKSRESALKWISDALEWRDPDEVYDGNPYEIDGFRLDVVELQ